jgi:hypothetical protein
MSKKVPMKSLAGGKIEASNTPHVDVRYFILLQRTGQYIYYVCIYIVIAEHYATLI